MRRSAGERPTEKARAQRGTDVINFTGPFRLAADVRILFSASSYLCTPVFLGSEDFHTFTTRLRRGGRHFSSLHAAMQASPLVALSGARPLARHGRAAHSIVEARALTYRPRRMRTRAILGAATVGSSVVPCRLSVLPRSGALTLLCPSLFSLCRQWQPERHPWCRQRRTGERPSDSTAAWRHLYTTNQLACWCSQVQASSRDSSAMASSSGGEGAWLSKHRWPWHGCSGTIFSAKPVLSSPSPLKLPFSRRCGPFPARNQSQGAHLHE